MVKVVGNAPMDKAEAERQAIIDKSGQFQEDRHTQKRGKEGLYQQSGSAASAADSSDSGEPSSRRNLGMQDRPKPDTVSKVNIPFKEIPKEVLRFGLEELDETRGIRWEDLTEDEIALRKQRRVMVRRSLEYVVVINLFKGIDDDEMHRKAFSECMRTYYNSKKWVRKLIPKIDDYIEGVCNRGAVLNRHIQPQLVILACLDAATRHWTGTGSGEWFGDNIESIMEIYKFYYAHPDVVELGEIDIAKDFTQDKEAVLDIKRKIISLEKYLVERMGRGKTLSNYKHFPAIGTKDGLARYYADFDEADPETTKFYVDFRADNAPTEVDWENWGCSQPVPHVELQEETPEDWTTVSDYQE